MARQQLDTLLGEVDALGRDVLLAECIADDLRRHFRVVRETLTALERPLAVQFEHTFQVLVD